MADLVRSSLDKSLRAKTLSDLVRVRGGEEVYLLIDVSGSMDDDMKNGKSKINALREVVADIKQRRPVKMIAFGGSDGGAYQVQSIPDAAGGTPLHLAIDLAKRLNVSRCIVISDGWPDNTQAALDSAKAFGGQIDVVYVGNPDDQGERFLKLLAEQTGGTEFHGDLSQMKELVGQIMGLLVAGTDDED